MYTHPFIKELTRQRSTTSLEEDDIEADETQFSSSQQPAVAENLPTLSLGQMHFAADAVEVPVPSTESKSPAHSGTHVSYSGARHAPLTIPGASTIVSFPNYSRHYT